MARDQNVVDENILARTYSMMKPKYPLWNKLLYKKEKKYVAANEQPIVENAQLAGPVALLENQLANL